MPDPTPTRTASGLSVIIPTLNEADRIAATLRAVKRAAPNAELIVIDGGSKDDTVRLARSEGARVERAPKGRGSQLAHGARLANGDVLWFLHADVEPPSGAGEAIARALQNSHAVGGFFSIRFEASGAASEFFTWLYPRLSAFGLVYGDAGIFVKRGAYQASGGFAAYPLFEDLDLVKRLRQHGRWLRLDDEVRVSARRFEHHPLLTCGLWMSLQALYWLGVSPHRLAKLYAPIRGSRRQRQPLTHTQEASR